MIAELACNGSEDTGSLRIFVFSDDDRCVLVELNVGTVASSDALHRSDYDCLYDITLLYDSARSRFLNAGNDDIADPGIASARAAENTDAHKFLCARIVSDLHK